MRHTGWVLREPTGTELTAPTSLHMSIEVDPPLRALQWTTERFFFVYVEASVVVRIEEVRNPVVIGIFNAVLTIPPSVIVGVSVPPGR